MSVAVEKAFLSLLPAGPAQRRLALGVAAASLLVFIAAMPFAKTQLARIEAFIPAYQSAVVINDLITAVLLFGQFSIARLRGLLVLACAYVFTALTVVVHTLSYPGLLAPGGVIGGGIHTTAWLYIFWHGGFPLLVMAYARLSGTAPDAAAAKREAALALAATLIVVALATLLVTVGHDWLPPVMDGHRNGRLLMLAVGATWGLSLLAILVLWRRQPHSVLDLWLMVVLFAWLADIGLGALLNGGRFDFGFYAGRIYGLLAASFVLMVLLLETRTLYAHLAHSLAFEREAAEERATLLRESNERLEARVAERSRQLEAEIVERERAQDKLRESQKLEAIGQLTGGIAHDFNNLLTVVVSNLDILCESIETDAEQRELFDAALRSALRGAELTKRLLAFGRRQSLEPKVIDINARLPDMVLMLKRTLGEQLRISAALGKELWPVYADASQIEDALLNLSINARDAMPNGGELVIETANARLDEAYAAQNAEVKTGEYVMLSVHDTGTGMPPEVIARAMEPFFTTKEQGKGTGLGLSMIYGFAKQSGGHLKIYSEVGFGTTVKLYLPRAQASEAIEAEAPSTTRQAMPTGSESILLVEDNDDVRQAARRQLADLGYRVRIATNGPAALAVLESGDCFDLLFSDVVMPGGMTGYDLAIAARRLQPRLKVLFATGYAKAPPAGDALGTRIPVLRKPYRKQELAHRVRETLDAPSTTIEA